MTEPTIARRRTALGWWIFSRGNRPFDVDSAWNTLLAGMDVAALSAISQFMNVAGGVLVSSVIVPIAGVVILLILRRPWSAGYFLLSIALAALAVQVLKQVFGRARPEEILVVSDYGSFPSGHAANAAVLAAVLVVLLPRVWTVVLGTAWVVVMAFSRTYLHAHWLSDTVGGALVGVGVALVCAALMQPVLAREQTRAGTGLRPADARRG